MLWPRLPTIGNRHTHIFLICRIMFACPARAVSSPLFTDSLGHPLHILTSPRGMETNIWHRNTPKHLYAYFFLPSSLTLFLVTLLLYVNPGCLLVYLYPDNKVPLSYHRKQGLCGGFVVCRSRTEFNFSNAAACRTIAGSCCLTCLK